MGRVLRAVLALVVGFVQVGAAESQAPVVRLGGPEVVKLTWAARSPVAHDLDGDGRVDLAVIDNEAARIVLLYQRRPGERLAKSRRSGLERWEPVLEDGAFRRETVSIGVQAWTLAIGDLDGDGRPDLVYTGQPDDLTVRYQGRDGEFDRTRVLRVGTPRTWFGALLVADLDRDGRDDLLMLTESELVVIRQLADGELASPDRYPLAGTERFGLLVADVNGDGIPDVLSQVSKGDHTLRLWLGVGDGSLGAEIALPLSESRTVLAPLEAGRDGPRLVRVESSAGAVQTVGFSLGAAAGADLERIRPRMLAAVGGDDSGGVAAIGDVTGDGRPDLVVANPRGASLLLLEQAGDGRFLRSGPFPSLADVRAMVAADLDADGAVELVMASPKERALAWTGIGPSGRLEYPRPLPCPGKPSDVVALDLDGDGLVEVAAVVEDGADRSVVILDRESAESEWQARSIPLAGMRVAPKAIRSVDVNQDGLPDLAVFAAHEPVRLLVNRGGGVFEELSQQDGFRRGLLEGVEPSGMTVGDVDGDGLAELLVASGPFARALRLSGDGGLEVVDQFNPRTSDSPVIAAAVWDPDGDGVPEVALVHADGEIELLRRGRDRVYRWAESLRVEPLKLDGCRVADLAATGGQDLVLLARDRIVWLPPTTAVLELEVDSVYETDLRDVSHSLLLTGDLTGDGRREIVVLDARRSRILEVLVQGEDDQWSSVLHFPVFEADPHYEGAKGSGSEPRTGLVADVTGDGRDDLVLLVHDRLLVYPQL